MKQEEQPNLGKLRRQLREWQRQWKMQDWTIALEVPNRLDADAPSPLGYVEREEFHRRARILLARTPETEADVPKGHAYTLAHEFAHVLTADMAHTFRDAIRPESGDWRAAMNVRWELAEERFCNAFAEAVTGKGAELKEAGA